MTARYLAPVPGYTPTIGRLVWILTHSRERLLEAVDGLSRGQLDHLHDAKSNSIGALLAHAVAGERFYQVVTFEAREPSAEEAAGWSAALQLGDAGRRQLRGHDLDHYRAALADTRAATLAAFSRRGDDWLEAPLKVSADVNAHWAWFHVAEDEMRHCGQIRWLRARLP